MSSINNIILNGTSYTIAGQGGGAITDEIVNKLMTILRNAVYVSDQSDNLDELETMLNEISYHEPKDDLGIFGDTVFIKELKSVSEISDNGWVVI